MNIQIKKTVAYLSRQDKRPQFYFILYDFNYWICNSSHFFAFKNIYLRWPKRMTARNFAAVPISAYKALMNSQFTPKAMKTPLDNCYLDMGSEGCLQVRDLDPVV
jgi:hypothetical protein